MTPDQLTALLPSAAIFIAAIAALITAVAYARRKAADTVSDLVDSLTQQLGYVTQQLDTAHAKIDVIRNELAQQRLENKGDVDGLLLRIADLRQGLKLDGGRDILDAVLDKDDKAT